MSNSYLTLTRRDDIAPVCPFCNTQINELYYRAKGLGWLVGRNVIYFCPHCKKIVGVAQSRLA
ncbi:MAG: hypothetical protein R3F48_01925 [Candidatus Zixiibacteriota bacterium]